MRQHPTTLTIWSIVSMNIYTPTVAYLYKWTDTQTNRWYIGSRTKQGCHPNDGYICSSRTVKPMILEQRSRWIRTVLCLGTPEYILDLETRMLTAVDAKNDPLSYNQHNGDGKFTSLGRPCTFKGKKLGPQSDEAKMKRSIALKGKKHTAEHRANNSAAQKGKVPWNKGKKGLQVAWNKGLTGAQVAWNKGVKQSEQHKLNNSLSHVGQGKGVSKPKTICRISDRKEMAPCVFAMWLSRQKGN